MTETRPNLDGGPAGSLAELLAAEARLEARVAAARTEADAILAAARAWAGARLEELAAELARDTAAHQAAHAAELDRQRHTLEMETAAAVHRFEALTDADIAGLGRWLAAEVIDPSAAAR